MNDKLKSASSRTLALAVSAAFPRLALLAGAIPPAADVFGYVMGEASAARKEAALDDLVAEVARLAGYEGAERDNRFVALLADCARQGLEDLLYDHHRTIFFGKSRASWPYVVNLTADRIVNHGGEPDNFSRRMARLLEKCEEQDIEVLRVAARCTIEMLGVSRPDDGKFSWADQANGTLLVGPWAQTPHTQKHRNVPTVSPFHAADLINLVGESRLGVKIGEGVLVLALDEPFTEPFLHLIANDVPG